MFNRTPPASTLLRSPEGINALISLLGESEDVDTLVRAYVTWADLAAADPASLAHHIGLKAATLRVPPTPPATDPEPPGVHVVTRFDPSYPPGVRDINHAPLMLRHIGELPTRPVLAITGATQPTAAGIEISSAAALAATTAGVPIAVPLTNGCSRAAAQTALTAGGTLILVMPAGFAVTTADQGLLEEAINSGGCAITATSNGHPATAATTDTADGIAVGLSAAVVLAEFGSRRIHGAVAAYQAVAAGRYIIVPDATASTSAGRFVPQSAFGSTVFASAKDWSAQHYGTNARIHARVTNGQTPADQVVTSHEQLRTAIVTACAPTPLG